MLLPLSSSALLLLTAAATSTVNAKDAVSKVVSMLKDMRSQSEADMHDEATKHSAFQSWCVETTTNLQASIVTLDDEIANNKNIVKAKESAATVLADAQAKAAASIITLESQKATEIADRKRAYNVYKNVSADYNESISAITNAITVLSSVPSTTPLATSLAQVQQSTNMSSREKELVTMLVQSKANSSATASSSVTVTSGSAISETSKNNQQPAQGASYAYESSSGSVVKLLEDLRITFTEEKRKADIAENNHKGASAQTVGFIDGEIKLLQEQITRDKLEEGSNRSAAGAAATELADDEKDVGEKRDALNTAKTSCQLKSVEFTERTDIRNQEIEALGNAIQVLGSVKTTTEAATDVSFIQIATKKQRQRFHRSDEPQPTSNFSVDKVSKFLQQQGQKMKSKDIQLLALRVMENPFDNVVKMVRTLVEKLTAEALQETSKFNDCKIKHEANTDNIQQSTDKMNELQAEIETQSGILLLQKERNKEFNTKMVTSATEMAEAGTLRVQEKQENTAVIQECVDGEAAVGQAVEILSEFYDKTALLLQMGVHSGNHSVSNLNLNNKSHSHLTVHKRLNQSISLKLKSVLQSHAKQVQPETWENDYSGNQAGNKGAISLLMTIQTNFLKLKSDTESSEAAAQASYTKFIDETQLNNVTDKANAVHSKQKASDAAGIKAQKEKELGAEEQMLNGFQEELKVIQYTQGCAALGNQSPEEAHQARTASRRAEIESLQEALSMLGSA